MPKMNLDQAFADGGKVYGPGESVNVPDEASKKIKATQEYLKKKAPTRRPQPSDSLNEEVKNVE